MSIHSINSIPSAATSAQGASDTPGKSTHTGSGPLPAPANAALQSRPESLRTESTLSRARHVPLPPSEASESQRFTMPSSPESPSQPMLTLTQILVSRSASARRSFPKSAPYPKCVSL